MPDPYKMVFVNAAASFLVVSGAIFYRFVYPKKRINLFVLLLIISVLPIISIFRIGDYESGDFNIHIYRTMSFYDSLREGNLMPSWAGELNATYGNPLFIFNYSLPYYIISLFHFLGLSFISSMKIYLGLTLYLSGLFMYLWMRETLNSKLAAFASAIFYVFNPYHLIDVHFRATPGESAIFTLVPLQMLFIVKYRRKKKFIYLLLISLFTGLLFLAHPLLASVFFIAEIIFVLFTAISAKKTNFLIFCIAFLIIGALSASHTWASFLLFEPYTFKIPASIAFYPFLQLFYSPWQFGLLFQGHYGELALVIGYAQLLAVGISIILIIRKIVRKEILNSYLFWIILFFAFLFLMNPESKAFWGSIPNAANMITPYGRLSLVLSLCTSVIVGYLTFTLLRLRTRKIYVYFLLTVAVGSTALNWGHRRVIPEINDAILRKNVWKSTASEGPSYFINTIWADKRGLWFDKLPSADIEILEGEGEIKTIGKNSTHHIYMVTADTPLKLRENTLYFPGWRGFVNGKEISISPSDKGIIQANVPQGVFEFEVKYKDIFIYKLLKTISMAAFIFALSLLTIHFVIQRKLLF